MADRRLLLADTSAWHRSGHPEVAEAWRRLLEEDVIATTEPVRLEVLYSARSLADYDAIVGELDALHQLRCDHAALRRALDVQRLMARAGGLRHRVAVPDLVIAAVAELGRAVLWHYDQDYDRIVAVTGQPTEWIAPRGTL